MISGIKDTILDDNVKDNWGITGNTEFVQKLLHQYEIVIPAKACLPVRQAGIQYIQYILDCPIKSGNNKI